MKLKFYFLIAVALFVGLSSCSSKKDDMKASYIEACADGNFSEARKIVEKMAAEDLSSYELDEHWEYVNDKEIYALLEDNSKDASNRIMYLFNTFERSQLPDMDDVLDVSISQGNEYLAGKLIKGGVYPNSTHATTAVNAEQPEIVDLIIKANPSLLVVPIVADFYIEENGKEDYENMLIKSVSSLDGTQLKKIATDKGLDRLLVIVKENEAKAEAQRAAEAVEAINQRYKEISGSSLPARPALGIVKSNHYGEIPEEYTNYSNAVSGYNSECMSLLSDAIDIKNWALAERIVGLMKPNLQWNDLGDWERVVEHTDYSSSYNAFKVTQNNMDEINAARKMISDAKRSN